MSRKKVRLDRRTRFFLEIQPTLCRSPEEVWLVVRSRKRFSAAVVAKFECKRRGKQDEVNHGSIRGSWPIAISGYPRGHSV
jgi:hypothetical protein